MKKIIFVFFFILYTFILSAQFHKGALVFDAKGAIDIYDTKVYHKDNKSGNDTTFNDKAVNRNISLGLEYGVMDKLGVGIRYSYGKYFAEPDDSTKLAPNIRANNISLMVNYHLINKKVFSLLGGINIGYSSLNITSNNIYKDEIYGKGLYFDVHVSPRVWMGSFGFQLDLGMPFANYTNVSTNNKTFDENYTTKMKFLGYSIGMGIQYRFLSKKDNSKSSEEPTE